MSAGEGVRKRDEDEEEESGLPPPPDGGWGWMVVFGSFMIHIITDGVTYSFGVFYDVFLDYFGEDQSKTSWILSALAGVTLASGPLSSALVNKWGCRTVTIMGSLVASTCLIASVFAENVTTLIVTVGIGAGVGFGLIYLPAIVSVTTYFEKKRSLATGIAVCGSGFGTFLFAPFSSWLIGEYGWRGSILIIAALVLECIIFGALFRPLEEDDEERDADKEQVHVLQKSHAKTDMHVSDHELHRYSQADGTSSIHRPHSVAHLQIHSKNSFVRSEVNGNVQKPLPTCRWAVSQPMLAMNKHGGSHYSMKKHSPFDRPDVFYQGSLMNIPSYRSRLDLKQQHEGSVFLERPRSSFAYKHKKYRDDDDGSTTICGVIPCSRELKENVNDMMDFSLFRDVIFIMFTISNFLTSIGFNIPYVFLVARARSFNLTQSQGSWLLGVVGIANTVGRVVLGYLSDKPWVNRLFVYNSSLTICGIASILSAFCDSFETFAIYAAVFGFTIGVYVGLTSVILVDLFGLEKLTNAFGLLLLFQGIASIIGSPIAGKLFDITQSYDWAFHLSGITVAFSGIILYFIPCIQRMQEKGRSKIQYPSEI